MGEVVGASLRLNSFAQPLRVLGIVCFYGAGVVLIREIAQRLRLSAWGVVLLGCAFALVEEGLALQTIFNPVGMDGRRCKETPSGSIGSGRSSCSGITSCGAC
jgi:hypothetical protein